MTTNELALILIAEQDEASDDSDFVTVVENWINDALDEFASAHDWRLFKATNTISTVAGTDEYDLATNVRDIRMIRFQDTNEELKYIDSQRLILLAQDFEQQSKPAFWYWKESEVAANPLYTIGLVPIPDATYVLEYLAVYHPTLSPLTSANLPLQREMIIAIKHRTRAYMLFSDKDYDGADRYLQMFYAKVNQLIERENAPKAGFNRLQVRDLSSQNQHKLVDLDPNHFR